MISGGIYNSKSRNIGIHFFCRKKCHPCYRNQAKGVRTFSCRFFLSMIREFIRLEETLYGYR